MLAWQEDDIEIGPLSLAFEAEESWREADVAELKALAWNEKRVWRRMLFLEPEELGEFVVVVVLQTGCRLV